MTWVEMNTSEARAGLGEKVSNLAEHVDFEAWPDVAE